MVSRRAKYTVRWKRAGLASRIAVLLIGAVLFSLLVYWQRPLNEEAYLESNVAVFALINLNVAILCILIFLVGRNVAKLIFDRRKGILGSKLRMRLVLAFVGLTLIPSVVLVFVASGLLSRAMEGWFSSPAGQSVSSALEVARIYYDDLEEEVEKKVKKIAIDVQSGQLDFEVLEQLREYLQARRTSEGLYALQLYTRDKELYVEAKNAAAQIEHFSVPEPSQLIFDQALSGKSSSKFVETEVSQFVRVYMPIALSGKSLVLIGTYRVRPEIAFALQSVSQSYTEYEQLKRFRNPLKSVYILTLYMFTGLIMFAAIWFGFYIAREITGPIQSLAEGTREVARGNYNVTLRQAGDDELGYLTGSFNRMTRDLSHSRAQAERRRMYIETVLGNLAVGVFGLDKRGKVTSSNKAALMLFEFSSEDEVQGKRLVELLDEDTYQQIEPLLEGSSQGEAREDQNREAEIHIVSRGQERTVLCTMGILEDPSGNQSGTILLFDDITELSQGQKMAAWREAARRIAHEIKNPLTPIRLAAQRLGKNAEAGTVSAELIHETTETIVEHTDSIKRLADEFSKFARMPDIELESLDVNTLISDVLAVYAEECPDIVIQFISDEKLPEAMLDREQIRRILVNIVDNAIAALRGRDRNATRAEQSDARVVVRTRYEKKLKRFFIEISDNGPGVPDADKNRIFQPYFTNTAGGTGLGLAIVSSLVADHQGDIRVYDNEPRGAKFIVEFPLVPATVSTQRRLHTGD